MKSLRHWLAERRLRRQLQQLTEIERQHIIENSEWDVAFFQGEGWHVLRKNVANMNDAYIASLGEIPVKDAEDWLILHELREAMKTKLVPR